MKLLTGPEMSAMDYQTIETLGIPGIVLMENAGQQVFESITNFLPTHISDKEYPIIILTGKGNNGGDGYVIGRKLIEAGHIVFLFSICPLQELKGDALTNAKIFQHFGTTILLNDEGIFTLTNKLNRPGILIDALFGTGLSKEVSGLYKNIIDLINTHKNQFTVFAVDIPSGICATTGKILGCAVQADYTITFAAPKLGHVLFPGAEYTGNLKVVDISIPHFLINTDAHKYNLITQRLVQENLPQRKQESHKGTYGKVLTIAGSNSMPGASLLTALAVLKIGAGLSYLYTVEENIPALAAQHPEIIFKPAHSRNGILTDIDEDLFDGMDAIAIGPGLTRHPDSQALVQKVVHITTARNLPLVLDADALHAVAQLNLFDILSHNCILTPHPLEFSALTGQNVQEIQENRLHFVENFIKSHTSVLVLKGNRTIIGSQESIYINPTGNSGLATGGTGDVLTGMLAGLLAQRIAPLHAAISGVYLHGLAGDHAAQKFTEYSVTASDVLQCIPPVVQIITKC